MYCIGERFILGISQLSFYAESPVCVFAAPASTLSIPDQADTLRLSFW